MPSIAEELLIVPFALAAILAIHARRVNLGNAVSQAFEASRPVLIRRVEMALDFLMMVSVAMLIVVVDHQGDGDAMFIYGLIALATVSVIFSGLACMWKDGMGAMIVRKVAFRSILGLGLFTGVLGLLAAGL